MDRAEARELAKTEERREAVETMMRFTDEYGFMLGTGVLKSTLHEGLITSIVGLMTQRLEAQIPFGNDKQKSKGISTPSVTSRW